MESNKQKQVFLDSEGDNWYNRNKETLKSQNFKNDMLVKEVLSLSPADKGSILEIGCGNGKRLTELKEKGFSVAGIDPSSAAVGSAKSNGIDAFVGTADRLPFTDKAFDFVIFGFCLYLCDREDLFKIAAEADRVLKPPGYLLILDFYSKTESVNDYHHWEGLKSYKMDYRKLFDWHPSYTLVKQIVGSHTDFKPTDDKKEWVAISVLRKVNI